MIYSVTESIKPEKHQKSSLIERSKKGEVCSTSFPSPLEPFKVIKQHLSDTDSCPFAGQQGVFLE